MIKIRPPMIFSETNIAEYIEHKQVSLELCQHSLLRTYFEKSYEYA